MTMMDSNAVVIQEMRKIISEGKPIDIDTRDRLLFSAVIDIYEKLEALQPTLAFYRVGLFFASAIGLSILAFIGALIMHKIDLVFK